MVRFDDVVEVLRFGRLCGMGPNVAPINFNSASTFPNCPPSGGRRRGRSSANQKNYLVVISFGSFTASRSRRHLDGEDSDGAGRFGFSPDSEPCLPVVPGAPAAVPPFGLVVCFCVAAPGFTLVPAAEPEVSPGAGPAAFATGAYNVINKIPANKRAPTAIVVTRCLL
jgi:hypothetical protein